MNINELKFGMKVEDIDGNPHTICKNFIDDEDEINTKTRVRLKPLDSKGFERVISALGLCLLIQNRYMRVI